MNMNPIFNPSCVDRRGSTLVIVIALLGLLAFLGMLFFSFASQERMSAEYFSEAAKAGDPGPSNVWDHMLRQVISGPGTSVEDRNSILQSPNRRHSIVSNAYGADVAPHSGDGVTVRYNSGTMLPEIAGGPIQWLNFVDAPAAYAGSAQLPPLQASGQGTPRPPADVDYTSADINTLFMAYKGWAVRDNGGSASIRFERVPVIIPSFFRPQYMKTSELNGPGANSVPTDPDWSYFDGFDRVSPKFGQRSMRPHPSHIVFNPDTNAIAYRYVTDAEAPGLGLARGFEFMVDANGNGTSGELGIWTGANENNYDLDVDNDGDGIRDGIWLDLHYPLQEYTNSSGSIIKYVVLHSVTVYDLDGLININVHGNLSGLPRSADLTNAASILFDKQFLSRSNLGLGPNEVNPLWAMRRGVPAVTSNASKALTKHFLAPRNDLDTANMELTWLLTGRCDYDFTLTTPKLTDVLPGRFGDLDRVFNVYVNGTFLTADLPRPGRVDFDDNQDQWEGDFGVPNGRVLPFATPSDYAGAGHFSRSRIDQYVGPQFNVAGTIQPDSIPTSISPREAWLYQSDPTNAGSPPVGPSRWPRFEGYSQNGAMSSAARYVWGRNGTDENGASISDDLNKDPFLNPLYEDPLECIFDPDLAQKDFDRTFGAFDLLGLQLDANDLNKDEVKANGLRLTNLAPYTFEDQSTVRQRFTTVGNSLRKFMMRSPYGNDGQPGIAGVDDNGNSIIDEPIEALVAVAGDTDVPTRYWEFSADTDGADQDGDGFPDGDGRKEFPPSFGSTVLTGRPFSSTDPFRPQVRRMLTQEAGNQQHSTGQLPISVNHLLDVERNIQTPPEGTAEFLYFMQRSGLRFRTLTDHPLASETDGTNTTDQTQNAYTLLVPAGSLGTYIVPNESSIAFPPQTIPEREFWARRDRQKLARDIYVLLYTTGGAQQVATSGVTHIRDYTGTNNPMAATGSALYTHDQLRQMAQLAVNMVDAMDSDNVITKFEYDKNLGLDVGGMFGGWNLDDDPYSQEYLSAIEGTTDSDMDGISDFAEITGNGLYREDSVERGVVYGVEAQELAFSEVLGIRTPTLGTGNDNVLTYDDEVTGRDHLFVELQNARPTSVPLASMQTVGATGFDKALWRLDRFDRKVDGTHPIGNLNNGGNPDRSLVFQSNGSTVQSVAGGGTFTIGMASTTSIINSDFFVDFNTDGTFELIAPNHANSNLPTTSTVKTDAAEAKLKPRCDLDLIHTDHSSRFVVLSSSQAVTANTDFLSTISPYLGNTQAASGQDVGRNPLADILPPKFGNGGDGFELVLRRRLNPNMPTLKSLAGQTADVNPWVEVDRIRVIFKNFAVTASDDATALTTNTDRLPALISDERGEPLDNLTAGPSTHASAVTYRHNTISNDPATVDRNSTTAISGFTAWQAHFDREYSSPMELLNLPTVGPELLTQRFGDIPKTGYQQSDVAAAPAEPKPWKLCSGAAFVLQPDFPNSTPLLATAVEQARDNRWYRLFQFVEVPSRVHRMLGNYVSLPRVPGKINVNTIREWEVYAGLIDNPTFMDRDVPANNRFTVDRSPDNSGNSVNRDRWLEFLKQRDGSPVLSYDPATASSKQFLIPATPNATPFHSPGYTGNSAALDNAINQTLLQELTADRPVADENRHWLEVADVIQHKNSVTSAAYTQPMLQHQILAKISNNTTTVSNAFIVYATAGYFEAYEDSATGLVRVGGRIDLEPNVSPPTNPGWQQQAVFILDRTEAADAYDPGTGDFDWKRLVKARATIE